jgi:hypothetical protein
MNSTHLICEDKKAEEFEHVEKLGGLIVTKERIYDCYKNEKVLPEKNYIFPKKFLNKDEKKNEEKNEEKYEEKNNEKKNEGYKKNETLLDLFTKQKFYIFNSNKKIEIIRYIIAFNGTIEKQLNKNVTHVIVDFFEDYEEINHLKKYKKITSEWIWNSINSKMLLSEKDYLIKD